VNGRIALQRLFKTVLNPLGSTRRFFPERRCRRLLIGVFLLALALSCGRAFSAPAPALKGPKKINPAEVAKRIREGLAKAKPEEYLLLLRDCIVQAQALGLPAEKNPFHQVLVSTLQERQPPELRIAVVRALTTPVAGSQPYLPGAELLLGYVGSEPPPFRTAVREGLALVIPQAGQSFVDRLKELVLSPESTRQQVEDGAYLLWVRDPHMTVNVLIEGLRRREAAGGDVAPYHWILTEYLHHREKNATGWERYVKGNPDAAAFRETHFTRRRIEEELRCLWQDLLEVLQGQIASAEGLGRVWPFLEKSLDSPWRSVRIGVCRLLGTVAQKYAVGTPSAGTKALLERQSKALLEVLGAGSAPRYEPLEVRLEALSALRFFRPVVGNNPSLVGFFKQVVTSNRYEQRFKLQALRAVADLELDGLRRPICGLITAAGQESPPSTVILTEAIRTLGKIGIEEPGSPDPALSRKVIEAIEGLYKKVEDDRSREAAALRQAAVSTLGKIGSSAAGADVTGFLRSVLHKSLETKEGASLAFYAIYALGELGDIATVKELAGILAKRSAYPAAIAEAAVDAIWLIGSSGQPEAATRAIETLAPYVTAPEAELGRRVLQKLVNLCRGSMQRVALLAAKLRDLGSYQAALSVLTAGDIKKVRQVALVEGAPQDFKGFWSVEAVLLDSLERLERFAQCAAEIERLQKLLAELKRGPDFEAESKAQQKALEQRLKRVQSKAEFLRIVAEGDPGKTAARLKELALAKAEALPWYVAKVRDTKLAEPVFSALLQDPEVREVFKRFTGGGGKTAPEGVPKKGPS